MERELNEEYVKADFKINFEKAVYLFTSENVITHIEIEDIL